MQSKIPGGYVPAWIPPSVFWISSGVSKAKRQLTGENWQAQWLRSSGDPLHLRDEKQPRAPAKIVTAKGRGNGMVRGSPPPPLFLWTTGGLSGHLAAVAQRVRPGWRVGVRGVEHRHAAQPSLIPRLCRCRSVRHGQVLKGGEAESQLSLSFSHLSVH